MSTFVLIEKYTVGAGGVSSVTLGCGGTIPQTYTDLVVKFSLQNNYAQVYVNNKLTFNGLTSGYTSKLLYSTGAASGSANNAITSGFDYSAYSTGSNSTASTFSNGEVTIFNYAGNNYKSISVDHVGENNASSNILGLTAGLLSNTASVTSITFTSGGGNFVQYSTFYLYGILKA